MDNQSEKTPPMWQVLNISYGAGLTLGIAKKMLEAGQREAEKQGVPMAIAITGLPTITITLLTIALKSLTIKTLM